jgi:hypothetical protein
VFDDDARNPRFIETITKRGYRLIPKVEYLDVSPSTPTSCDCPCAVVVDEKEILLAKGEHLIGRIPGAIVRIDSDEVSRRHARIVVSSEDAILEDLGSKNGTYLWGERVDEPTQLTNGDEITVGPAVLTFLLLASLTTTRTAQLVDGPRDS